MKHLMLEFEIHIECKLYCTLSGFYCVVIFDGMAESLQTHSLSTTDH